MRELPYIYIDNDLDLNAVLLLLVVENLAYSSKRNPKLDFGKLQVFLYLAKNPGKINKLLLEAGKKAVSISDQFAYTMDGLSSNVDILYDRRRLKVLIKRLAGMGLISAVNDSSNGVSYIPAGRCSEIKKELSGTYVEEVSMYIGYLKPLQALSTSKLFSLVNGIIKEH